MQLFKFSDSVFHIYNTVLQYLGEGFINKIKTRDSDETDLYKSNVREIVFILKI